MSSVIDTFQRYMGTGLTTILFLLALVYLFLCEKRKPRRILFVYSPVFILLLYFNPLFAKLFDRLAGLEIYFRLFWLLPYMIVLPYTAVLLAERMKGLPAGCAAFAAAALIVVSGRLVYLNPLYGRAENVYHVPDSVVEICDAIEVPGREVMAVFPRELLLYVRQYSPKVCMPYGREVYLGVFSQLELYDAMESGEIKLPELVPLSREMGCHYVVLRKEEIPNDTESWDWKLFFETEEYAVYRDTYVPLEIPQEIPLRNLNGMGE